MEFFKNKENLLILCIVALVLFLSMGREDTLTAQQPLALSAAPEEITENASGELYVHLTGRVQKPGVIRLEEGARLQDAVERAGGLFPDADTTRINLSMKLKDEDKIHIPATGEEEGPAPAGVTGAGEGLVDLNHADAGELQTLPGIGPQLAQRILEYREQTLFTSVEEIKNVRGIGDKLFDGMKEQITVR